MLRNEISTHSNPHIVLTQYKGTEVDQYSFQYIHLFLKENIDKLCFSK